MTRERKRASSWEPGQKPGLESELELSSERQATGWTLPAGSPVIEKNSV
jgi:hypothetical protein